MAGWCHEVRGGRAPGYKVGTIARRADHGGASAGGRGRYRFAMSSIVASFNIGSGIDTAKLIDELVAAEKTARTKPLTARKTALDARISALAEVKSSLLGIAGSLDTRLKSGALGLLPASSDPGRVAVARLGDGPANGFRSTLSVTRLASAQLLTAAPLAGEAAPVGQGVLTIALGTRSEAGSGFSFAGDGRSFAVTIGPDNNSLAGLRDAINASGSGIVASIVTSAAGASLSLRGADGAAQAFTLSAAPASGDTAPGGGLARFAYAPGGAALTLATAAGDAALTLDGIAVTRAGNTIDDLIPGTRLTLLRADAGTTTLSAARDPAALESTLSDLATTLGAMRSLVGDFRRSASGDIAAGALLGDPTARGIDQGLARLVGAAIPQANGMRLADLGFGVARDGAITFDAARLAGLTPARLADAEGLLKTMAAPALSTQPNRLKSLAELATPAAAGFTSQRSRLTGDLDRIDQRLATYRDSLVRQYAAMDRAVAASKATQEALTRQIEAWTASLSR